MVEYQTLMNLSYLETDIITAEQIDATKIDVSDLTAQNLSITSAITVPTLNATNINTTNFKLTTGAQNNYYLKSDALGNASWATVPAPSNMATTDTAQTISGGKIFSSAVIISPTTNQLKLYNATLTAPSTTGRVYTIPDVGANATLGFLEGTQSFTGAKTFSDLIASAFRFSTAPQNGYILTSDAAGNCSWAAPPTTPANMATTDTNQTITGIKTFTPATTTTAQSVNFNSLTSLDYTSVRYLGDINLPSGFSSVSNIVIRIYGTMANASGTPDGGARIYDRNNNLIITRQIGALSSTSFDTTGTYTTVNITSDDFPLKVYEFILYPGWIINTFYFEWTLNYISNTEGNALLINKIGSQLILGTTTKTIISARNPTATRTVSIIDAGSDSELILSKGTQYIDGAKTFSNLITSALRLTTNAGANKYLISDSSGNASWASGSVMLLDQTQIMTQSKTLNTSTTGSSTQDQLGSPTQRYGGNEIFYRYIQCPSNMGGYAVSFTTRIMGICDPITSSPQVCPAGIRIYKNGETTHFYSINSVVCTTSNPLPNLGGFDTGTLTFTISDLKPNHFPLRVTMHNSLTGAGDFNIYEHNFTLNYFVASINDISGIKAYTLKIDDLGGVAIPSNSSVDTEGDNFIVLQTTDIGNNTIRVKLKDVIKYMYSSLFIPSSYFGFKTTITNIYSEAANNWWFIDSATGSATPLIVEVEAKLKKGVAPIYLGFDPSPPVASNTDPVFSNPFIEDQLIRYKIILKHSSTNVGLTWVARTIGAGTHTDGWTTTTTISYGVATSRLAIFIQCYYGGWFNNNYNTRMTNIAVAGNPTLSRTGENRFSILDYFDVFKIRGYV